MVLLTKKWSERETRNAKEMKRMAQFNWEIEVKWIYNIQMHDKQDKSQNSSLQEFK